MIEPPNQLNTKRFQVALSFAGEHRNFVEGVAEQLSRNLGQNQPFPAKAYAIENKWLIPSDFRKHKANRINNICILCR